MALFFYSHLSLCHPQVRDLFPISMAGQRDKFVSALGRIVAGVDHAATLAHFEGDHWTPQLAADWLSAYQQIAAQMIDAATHSSNSTNAAVEDA